MESRSMIGCLLLTVMATWLPAAFGDSLFEDQTVLDITLTGPLSSLLADKESSEYHPFELLTGDATVPVEVRLRGNSRRRVCEFPPLRLKFDADSTAGTAFAGQDKLKLVTHCRNIDRGEQDLLEEFLAYRIFNALTDTSLRVRLLRVHYRDTLGRTPDEELGRFGFLIEPSEGLAARTGMNTVTLPGVPVGGYDIDHANLVYVFQFLVGNTDWSLVRADYDEGCCHNIELFDNGEKIMLVPYDFDLTGLVNARYAFPDRTMRIKRVTQRLYRGVCADLETVRGAIRQVNQHRDQILRLVDELPGLDADNRETARDYLDDYFELAADEEKLISNFERRCL